MSAQTVKPEVTSPRIYVACLAAYNNGILHGAWIDADQDASMIWESIAEMLAKSPIPGAEEHAIHGFEGFAGFSLSEYESIEDVAALAEAIQKYGPAFAAYAGNCGDIKDALEHFEEAYCGEYDSEEDYAYELVHECYREEDLGPLANYLDYEAYARDLFMDGYWSAQAPRGIYVFRNL